MTAQTFRVLAGMVFCHDSLAELFYNTSHSENGETLWRYQARVMREFGWIVRVRAFAAFCPECAAARGLLTSNYDDV